MIMPRYLKKQGRLVARLALKKQGRLTAPLGKNGGVDGTLYKVSKTRTAVSLYARTSRRCVSKEVSNRANCNLDLSIPHPEQALPGQGEGSHGRDHNRRKQEPARVRLNQPKKRRSRNGRQSDDNSKDTERDSCGSDEGGHFHGLYGSEGGQSEGVPETG